MRTGKQVFNYYKYALIWADRIVHNYSGYSLEKAYQIDSQFGALVESALSVLKRQKSMVNKVVRLAAYFYDTFMTRLSQEEAKIIAQTKQLTDYVDNLTADYKSMSTEDFLKKYAYRDWSIDMSDLDQSIFKSVMKDINQSTTAIIKMTDYLINSVELADKTMKEILND